EDGAAVGGHQLVRHGEAEARTALAGRALESLEQVGSRLLRHAGAVVAHVDGDAAAVARGRHADMPLEAARSTPLLLLDGLQGVAAQVAQDPVELVAVAA